MDLIALLHLAWRITRTQPALWALHALLLVSGLPTVIISGAFGAGGAAQELDPALLPTPAPQFLPNSDPATLALGWLIGLALIVVFSAATQVILAAIYRVAARSVEPCPALSLRASLKLGGPRIRRILGLSLTLGAALSLLAFLPLLLAGIGAPPLIIGALQPLLAPLNLAGGLVLLLLILALSLEDVRGHEAPARAWAVFKRGWVGFVLVLALTVVWSLVVGLLATPAIFLAVLVWLWPGLDVGAQVMASVGLGLICGAPIAVAIMASTLYTNVLQTLIYREAARGLGS